MHHWGILEQGTIPHTALWMPHCCQSEQSSFAYIRTKQEHDKTDTKLDIKRDTKWFRSYIWMYTLKKRIVKKNNHENLIILCVLQFSPCHFRHFYHWLYIAKQQYSYPILSSFSFISFLLHSSCIFSATLFCSFLDIDINAVYTTFYFCYFSMGMNSKKRLCPPLISALYKYTTKDKKCLDRS